MIDRHLVPCRGRIRHILFYRVVDVQFPALLEEEDAGRGELLRHRSQTELRRRRVGDLPLEIRVTVSLVKQYFSIALDEHSTHELLRLNLRLDDLLHTRQIELRGGWPVCLALSGRSNRKHNYHGKTKYDS